MVFGMALAGITTIAPALSIISDIKLGTGRCDKRCEFKQDISSSTLIERGVNTVTTRPPEECFVYSSYVWGAYTARQRLGTPVSDTIHCKS